MKIGIDFDNTIVCYDGLFHRVAVENGFVAGDTPVSKGHVRDAMRRAGMEEQWIWLQGLVYGSRMVEAEPFEGVHAFFRRARSLGIDLFIVSHKTRHPFRGPAYDLHEAARNWLDTQGFHAVDGIALPPERAFFELTKTEKLQRIGALGCTHFVDDLPEFLAEPGFPGGVHRLLFDPAGHAHPETGFERVASWAELSDRLLPCVAATGTR